MVITQLTKTKNVHFQKPCVKTMPITFFDSKGAIHKEFMPEERTVNGEYYQEVFKCLLMRIKCTRPNLEHSAWQVLNDNAPAHTVINVRTFLANGGVAAFNHSPYSLDLTQGDFSVSQVEFEMLPI
jgi:hypothetical protein